MKTIYLSLLFLFIQCSDANNNLIAADEYNILSVGIDSFYSFTQKNSIVICDSTNNKFINGIERSSIKLDSLYLKIYISNFAGKDSSNIYKSITYNNRSRFKIDLNKLNLKSKSHKLSLEGFRNKFLHSSINSGWNLFYKDYPNSSGYILFCRPGINVLNNKAILFFEFYCGSECGEGLYLLLEKENNNWKITKKKSIWES